MTHRRDNGRMIRSHHVADCERFRADVLLRRGDTPESLLARANAPMLEARDHIATWVGLPLLAGHDGPVATVSALLDRLDRDRLDRESAPDPITELEGIFALFLYAKKERRWYVFGDQGGLLRLFYDQRAASTSLLAILADNAYTPASIDLRRALEFMLQEANFGPSTMIEGIRVLTPEHFLVVDEASIGTANRRRAAPARSGDTLLDEFFQRNAASVRRYKTSVDLTGGADSRVVFSVARRHLPMIEASVIGDDRSPDVQIAVTLAERCQVPIYVHHHDLGLLEQELWPTFLAGDGIIDIVHFHPNWQHMRVRLVRGVELVVHGGGGELFRDGYCLQDFPFYGVIPPRLERFYDWRLCPVTVRSDWLVSPHDVTRVRSASLESMRSLAMGTNCSSYDRIFYTLKAPPFFGQFFSAYRRMGSAVIAPLLEWRNAAWAMSQPGSQKLMHRWHRARLAQDEQGLGAILTTEGCRLLDGPWGLIRDLPSYLTVWARKIGRKTTQRLLGTTKFLYGSSTMAEAGGFIEAVRASSELRAALEALVRLRFARSDTRPTAIHTSHLGRVLAVGMLTQFLEGRR